MNKKILGYALLLVLSLFAVVSGSVQADPLDNWHWKNPIPQGNALRGVSFGSNKFVAVGDYGTILTSTDLGINWNNRTALNDGSAGTRENLRAIAFGNIGGSVPVAPGFVAVGDNGAILKSTDGGISWALDSTSGVTANFHSVAYGVDATAKQSFVAVGENGTVARTNDGLAWSVAANAAVMAGEMLSAVAYGAVPNTFVTISNSGNIFYSTNNGDTWTKSPDSNSSRPLRGVSFVNGNFIAVGTAGAIISSANGVNWVVQSSGTAADLNAVTYGAINDTIVVVGNVSKIIGSTTGFTTWRSFPFPEQSTPSNYNILAVTNDGDKTYIAVGENGEILRYNPGAALAFWTAINTGLTNTNVSALAYNTASTNTGTILELYAATGGGGIFYTKNAGLNWSAINTGLNNLTVNSIAMTPGSGATDDVLYTGTAGGLYKSIDAGNAAGTVSRIVIPPANVKITAGVASNTLTWNAVTGAASYNVYRSTTAGVTKPSGLLGTAVVTNYTDNTSANGITYYYAVTANFANSTNTANQESSLSSEVSAKPQISAVYVPDNAAVTAGVSQNTVGWSAVAGAGSYNVAIDGVKQNVGNTTTYTHAATNGTNHTYSVTAVNVVRTPANIAVSKGVITWDAVAGAGSYEISINGGAFVAASSPYTFNGHVTSYSINALNIQTAAVPSTTVTESLVTWAAVAGATSYNVSINGGASINVLTNSYTHIGVVTSNSITAVGGPSDGSSSVGTVTVMKTGISWPAVALTDSYSTVINGGAAVTPVGSPYTFNGAVTSATVTALDNTRNVVTGSLVSTITWDAPAVEPTTYTVTINGVVQPIQNAPLTSFDFTGIINPGFTVISTKAESDTSSVVGATPQAIPIQLTSVNTVIVDPVNANTIYLANNSGLFKSTDAALTFTELLYDAAPTSFANVNSIVVDKNTPTTLYVGATGGLGTGIYKSTNGGASWALLKTGLVNTIALDPTTTSTVYLGTTLGAFKSSDSGTTWNVTNPGLGSFPVNYFGINPVSPSVIYMGTDLGIFVTYNFGTDWSGFSNGLTSSLVNAIAFDPGKTEQIYAGTGGGGMYKLTDVFNINWSSQRNDIVFNSSSKSSSEFYGIGFGADNFVAVGNNNSITLLGNASLPVVTGNFRAVVYGDNSYIAVGAFGSEGAVYRSDSAGVSWVGPLVNTSGVSIASSGLYAISYGNGTFVAAGLSGKLLTYTGNVYNNNLVTGVTTHLRAAAFGNGVFVVAGDNGAIITSGDAATWTVRNSGVTAQINALSYGNGKFVAVGAGGVILVSNDNGVSWQSVASPTTGTLYGVAYGNGVFAAVGEDAVHGTVLTSSDDGATWTPRPSGTVNALYAVAFGKGQFYASGRFGTVIMSDIVPSAPATVTGTTPASGTTGVPVNAPITVTFSANMNGGTITTGIDGTTGSFRIVPAVTVPPVAAVTGASINYDSGNFRATLSHSGSLSYGTDYTATLTTTILDAAGNSLPAVYSWVFTTEPKPDTDSPIIISALPGNAETDVVVTTPIQVTFSQSDVNPSTVNSNTFKLSPNVAGSVTFNGMIATFTPTPPGTLAKGVTYTATVTTGVKDMAGNAMLAPYTWSFTTISAYTVSVSAGANGTITPGTIAMDKGTSQVFTISPASGFSLDTLTLDGASVKNQVIGNTYTLSNVTANHVIAATFKQVHQIQTTVASGSGTITGSIALDLSGKVTVDSGSVLSLTITPSAGLSLASLTDNGAVLALNPLPANLVKAAVANADGTYTWTYTYASVTADHNIVAVFSQDVTPPVVTVTSPAAGTTNIDINSSITATFNKLVDPATITAATFLIREKLSGISVISVPTPSLSGLTATFKPSIALKAGIQYEVVVTTGVKDLVTPANSMATAYVWTFTTRPATHAVTLTTGANGSVSSNPAALGTVTDSSSVVFTITPNTGYHIADVKLDTVSVLSQVSGNSYTLNNVIANHAVDVTFAINTYALTTTTGVNGTLTRSTATPDYGSSPNVTIRPAAGYILESVSDSFAGNMPLSGLVKSAQNADGTYTWTYTISNIAQNRTVSAVFRKLNLIITLPAAGTGTVTPSIATPAYGESPIITFMPAIGYRLKSISDSISGNLDLNNPPAGLVKAAQPDSNGIYSWTYTISNMSQDRTINAVFERTTYSITIDPQIQNGTVTSADPSVFYKGFFSLTITSSPGYFLDTLVINGTNAAILPVASSQVKGAQGYVSTYNYQTGQVTQNTTVSATFVQKFVITASATGSGSIPNPGLSFYLSGAAPSYTFTPNSEQYRVVSLKLDGVAVTVPASNRYDFTPLTADHSIEVAFDLKQFNVSVAPTPTHGAVSLSSTTVNYGGSSLASVIPAAGYKVKDILLTASGDAVATNVFGQAIATASGTYQYTLSDIRKDYSISATFDVLQLKIATSVATGGGGTIVADNSAPNYGSSVKFTMTANPGYTLKDVTVDGVSKMSDVNNGVYTLSNVTADHTVVATFAINSYLMTVSVNDSSLGSITPSGSVRVNYGQSQAFQISTTNGSVLTDITLDGISVKSTVNNNILTLNNVVADHTLVVTFTAPAATVYPDGDLNGDGKVDIADALLALKLSVGLMTPVAKDIAHGDVGPTNDKGKPVPDGKIDINDVVVMLQRVVGNIPAW